MTAGLAAGITAAVAVACAVGAYVYSAHHFRTLIEGEQATALAQGEIMRAALEHQMIENDRSLIAQMVESFGEGAARRAGRCCSTAPGVARFSSAPCGTRASSTCARRPARPATACRPSGGTRAR